MENQLMVSLSKNKLLKNVDISKIDLQSTKGRLITLGEGEILYREGDYSDCIFLVVSGEINVLKKRLLGKTKSFIYSENDFLGHEEFLEETARTSTAVALRDSYLISLLKEEIDNLTMQDRKIVLNMQEPIADIDTELGLKKGASPPKVEDKPQLASWSTNGLDEFNKTKSTIYDSGETQEFFNSISDTSRMEKENIIQPLDKIEEQKETETQKKEPVVQDTPRIGDSIFNEDGIIKSEFEIPDFPIQEDLPKVEFNRLDTISLTKVTANEDDLNDALFNMLSGTNVPPAEPEKEPEEPKLHTPEKPTEDDQQYYASIKTKEPEAAKIDLLKEEKTPPPIEPHLISGLDVKPTIEINIPHVPPYLPLSNNFDTDDIFAQADAQIKALVKEIPPVIEPEPTPAQMPDFLTKSRVTKEYRKMSGEDLEIIIRAAELVNSTIKVDEVLKIIVDVAIEFTNADRGTLYLVDKERSEIWSLIVSGNAIKEYRLKIGEGLAGFVAKTGETLNIKDVQNDSRFNKDYDNASGYKTRTMICFPIKNNKGEIIGVLQLINSKNVQFTDHDENLLQALSIHAALALQNAEMVEKLLQNERIHSLGKMANFLIQDIKRPVLVSKRYTEHLLIKQLTPEASQIVKILLEQLTQVADIVQTTSSYSDIKTMLRLNPISLNNVLNDYYSRIETYVVSRSCQIYNEFDKDITVKLDIKEFFQCYMHIIKNACDAMPDGGSIHISTQRDDKKVKIFFRDTGFGIPEVYKDKIFEPFTSYGKKEGTGLGLAITKKIIEAHKGKIEVESLIGSGITFIITLPAANLY
jgi:signal transduction histidine kinase